jgi:Methylamine utilisation protein MauE
MQPLVIAAALVWAGCFKLFARTAPLAAAQSGLSHLVGQARVVPAFRALGALELTVAALLLVAPAIGGPAAILMFTGFVGYLAYTRVAAPASTCGCASAQTHPIGWRNFAYAGSLLAVSLLFWVPTPWPVVLAEALALALITPDLDRYWLYPLRRLRARLTHPLRDARSSEVPLLATVEQLQRSEAYRRVGAQLRSDVLESWDEGEWRLLRYTIHIGQNAANAVFAVPRLTDEPERVRLAIVE